MVIVFFIFIVSNWIIVFLLLYPLVCSNQVVVFFQTNFTQLCDFVMFGQYVGSRAYVGHKHGGEGICAKPDFSKRRNNSFSRWKERSDFSAFLLDSQFSTTIQFTTNALLMITFGDNLLYVNRERLLIEYPYKFSLRIGCLLKPLTTASIRFAYH